MRALSKNLLLLIATLVTCLLCVELLTRLLLPPHPIYREPQPRHDPDPILGWVLRPNQSSFTQDRAMHSNAQGLRDSEDVPDGKPAGERRILALGDSFTFGNGVADDETYAEVLEGLLQARGMPVRVLNAGVQGYNLYQEADWLNTRGAALEPDLVLVGIFLNDIVLPRSPEVIAASLRAMGNLGDDNPSAVLRRRAIYTVKRLRSVVFFGSAMREVRWRWFAAANDYHTAAMFFERSSAASEQAWSEVDGALARIRDTASLAGCQVVAIVFPQHGQLAAGPLERTYQGRLLPILDDLGIAKVDLLPVYRAAAGAGRNPFIPYDGHPNAVGHHLAAEAALASVWTALGNADAPTERP